MATEAGICNIALARIGQREFIDSLNEATVAGQVCDALYEDARDALLVLVPWRFATRRQTLARLSNVTRSGWEYAYTLPSGCLSPRHIYAGTRTPAADQRIPFAVEDEATVGPILLTDHDAPELIYTARIETTGLFPPLFIDCLAWRLATDLARALPVKPGVADAMSKQAELALVRAAAAEVRKAQEDVQPDAEHIRAR